MTKLSIFLSVENVQTLYEETIKKRKFNLFHSKQLF